jgi:nucleotide-binding universal stress UspA family protein
MPEWFAPGGVLNFSKSGGIMLPAEDFGQIGQITTDINVASREVDQDLITHILAPTDLSDESRKALQYAVDLAEYFNTQLTLLHVWAAPSSHQGGLGELDPEAIQRSRDRAELMLRNLQDIIRERHSNTESYFLTGEPGSQIVALAKSAQVDLIVISMHDYDWLTRFFEGSDAEKILRHSACPVWIVREGQLV